MTSNCCTLHRARLGSVAAGVGLAAGAVLAAALIPLTTAPTARADDVDPLADMIGSPAGDPFSLSPSFPTVTLPLDQADQLLNTWFPGFAGGLDQSVDALNIPVTGPTCPMCAVADHDPFSDLIGAPDTIGDGGVALNFWSYLDSLLPPGWGAALDPFVDSIVDPIYNSLIPLGV